MRWNRLHSDTGELFLKEHPAIKRRDNDRNFHTKYPKFFGKGARGKNLCFNKGFPPFLQLAKQVAKASFAPAKRANSFRTEQRSREAATSFAKQSEFSFKASFAKQSEHPHTKQALRQQSEQNQFHQASFAKQSEQKLTLSRRAACVPRSEPNPHSPAAQRVHRRARLIY